MHHCMGLVPSQSCAEAIVKGLHAEFGGVSSTLKCLFADDRGGGMLGFRVVKDPQGVECLVVTRFPTNGPLSPVVLSVEAEDVDQRAEVMNFMRLLGATWVGHD